MQQRVDTTEESMNTLIYQLQVTSCSALCCIVFDPHATILLIRVSFLVNVVIFYFILPIVFILRCSWNVLLFHRNDTLTKRARSQLFSDWISFVFHSSLYHISAGFVKGLHSVLTEMMITSLPMRCNYRFRFSSSLFIHAFALVFRIGCVIDLRIRFVPVS